MKALQQKLRGRNFYYKATFWGKHNEGHMSQWALCLRKLLKINKKDRNSHFAP